MHRCEIEGSDPEGAETSTDNTLKSQDNSLSHSPHIGKLAAALMTLIPMQLDTHQASAQDPLPVEGTAAHSRLSIAELNIQVDLYCVDRSGGTGDLYTRSGLMAGINQEGVTLIDEAAKETVVPHSDLIRVALTKAPGVSELIDATAGSDVLDLKADPERSGGITVHLSDGSRIQVDDIALEDRDLSMKAGSANYTCPALRVQSVRFSSGNQHDEAWDDIASGQDNRLHTLVVRKGSRLSDLQGGVGSITADTVEFNFDDNKYEVARSKIEGVVFGPFDDPSAEGILGGRKTPPAVCKLSGEFGEVRASEVTFDDDGSINITTPSGGNMSVRLEQVSEFDFTPCKGRDLVDLTRKVLEWTPLVGIGDVDHQFESMLSGAVEPIIVGTSVYEGQEYSNAVKFSASVEAEVYLRRGYDHLIGYVGVDDSAGPGSSKLTVFDGERVLFNRDFKVAGAENPFQTAEGKGESANLTAKGAGPEEESRPARIPIDIGVADVHRLGIKVEGNLPITFFSPQVISAPEK